MKNDPFGQSNPPKTLSHATKIFRMNSNELPLHSIWYQYAGGNVLSATMYRKIQSDNTANENAVNFSI